MEKPTLRVAAIMRNSSSKLEIPCTLKIYYPLDTHENFRIQIEVKSRGNRTDDLLDNAWDIESTHPHRQILVADVHIAKVESHWDVSGQSTGFEIKIDYAQRLTISLSQHTEAPSYYWPAKHCFFYLSNLDYGTQQLNIIWNYLGGGEPNGVEPLAIVCPIGAPLNSVKLTRHYQYREERQLKRTVVGSQAVLVADTEPFPSLTDTGASLAYIKDIALLLSLAARHPVAVISEVLAGEKWQRESHWRPLDRLRTDKPELPFPLIEQTELVQFLELALERWQAMKPDKQEVLRHVLATLNSWNTAVTSDSFLAMFTALESLTNVPPIGATRLALQANAKGLIADVINNIEGLSDEEKKSWRKNIYKLWQGRAQQDKSVGLLEQWGVSNYSLWPLIRSEAGPGLLCIRNDLAHGRTFNRQQQRALAHAADSLKLLLERVVLSMLNYPYQSSNASFEALGQGSWKETLREHQRQLMRPGF